MNNEYSHTYVRSVDTIYNATGKPMLHEELYCCKFLRLHLSQGLHGSKRMPMHYRMNFGITTTFMPIIITSHTV